MIFISSQAPFNRIQNNIKDKEPDWFIFASDDFRKDKRLQHVYYLLHKYPFLYREPLYNYLISDNYYYKSPIYKEFENVVDIICIKRITETYPYGFITYGKDRIFNKDDINKMFHTFNKNNFRENPICEYMLLK